MLLENLINTDHGVRGDRLAVVLTLRVLLLVEETGVPGENHRSVASHYTSS
jgi:hypothetical protein